LVPNGRGRSRQRRPIKEEPVLRAQEHAARLPGKKGGDIVVDRQNDNVQGKHEAQDGEAKKKEEGSNDVFSTLEKGQGEKTFPSR